MFLEHPRDHLISLLYLRASLHDAASATDPARKRQLMEDAYVDVCTHLAQRGARGSLTARSLSVRIFLADIRLHLVELSGAPAAAAADELLWQQLSISVASAPDDEQWLDPADEVIDPSSMYGWELEVCVCVCVCVCMRSGGGLGGRFWNYLHLYITCNMA